MSAFRIDYRRRGARKWLADPRRRLFTERATAEADLEGIDQDQWETRIVEILRDKEPDYRARLQLEGRWEPSPWPDRPALRWTVYLAGGREGLRLELYDTFSQERADHFAQSVIDMLKEGLHPRAADPADARRVDRLSCSPLPTAGFTTAALSAPEPEVTPAHDELAVRATLDGVVMIAA